LSGTHAVSLDGDIRLDHVTFGYGDKRVLDDVSLTIPKGRITVIVGPSGAGKTSIVDLVSGMVRPQKGDVFVHETAIGDTGTLEVVLHEAGLALDRAVLERTLAELEH